MKGKVSMETDLKELQTQMNQFLKSIKDEIERIN